MNSQRTANSGLTGCLSLGVHRIRRRSTDKSPEWIKAESFFRDVAAQLTAVKRAWRNPTMHIERQYSPTEAEAIFNAVRVFMLHLATKLTE